MTETPSELKPRPTLLSPSYIGQVAAVAVLYVLAALAGLRLDAVSGFASLVWPPTGIALAAVLLAGRRIWPGIFVAALVANLLTGAPAFAAAGIATGNTLEAIVGALALKRVTGFRLPRWLARRLRAHCARSNAVHDDQRDNRGRHSSFRGPGIGKRNWARRGGRGGWATRLALSWSRRRSWSGRPDHDSSFSAPSRRSRSVGARSDGREFHHIHRANHARRRTAGKGVCVLPAADVGGDQIRTARERSPPRLSCQLSPSSGLCCGEVLSTQPTLHESLLALQTFMGITAATFLVLGASISERERSREQLREARRCRDRGESSEGRIPGGDES